MEELQISGKLYISSREAAKLFGYHADYIGQLARSGKVKAQKVGRTWYVAKDSLAEHLGSEPRALEEQEKIVKPVPEKETKQKKKSGKEKIIPEEIEKEEIKETEEEETEEEETEIEDSEESILEKKSAIEKKTEEQVEKKEIVEEKPSVIETFFKYLPDDDMPSIDFTQHVKKYAEEIAQAKKNNEKDDAEKEEHSIAITKVATPEKPIRKYREEVKEVAIAKIPSKRLKPKAARIRGAVLLPFVIAGIAAFIIALYFCVTISATLIFQ